MIDVTARPAEVLFIGRVGENKARRRGKRQRTRPRARVWLEKPPRPPGQPGTRRRHYSTAAGESAETASKSARDAKDAAGTAAKDAVQARGPDFRLRDGIWR